MTRSTVFKTNKTQAVRLPKPVAFPDEVHAVEIIKRGRTRIISPAGHRWDDLFANGTRLPEDFMPEREQPAMEEREPL